jgi:hypothetical protein
MADDLLDKKRIGELHLALTAYRDSTPQLVAKEAPERLWIRHPDGSVYDNSGRLLKPAPKEA